jgi:hypothetical protein
VPGLFEESLGDFRLDGTIVDHIDIERLAHSSVPPSACPAGAHGRRCPQSSQGEARRRRPGPCAHPGPP